MDASKMYPNGFHPIQRDILPDYSRIVKPLPRSEAIPKYYYTGFDVSVFISSDTIRADPTKPQDASSEATVPSELAAFKVDISAMGSLLEKEIFEVRGGYGFILGRALTTVSQRFTNFEFLWPLIHSMVKESPDDTLLSAPEVMEKWISIKNEMSPEDRKKPLRHRGDRYPDERGYTIDVIAIVRVILYFARSLVLLVRG